MYILFLKYLLTDWNIEQTGSSGDDSDWHAVFPGSYLVWDTNYCNLYYCWLLIFAGKRRGNVN